MALKFRFGKSSTDGKTNDRKGIAKKYLGKTFLLHIAGSNLASLSPETVLLEEYSVGAAKVGIYEHNGDGYYWITEPPMGESDLELYNILMNAIYYTVPPSDEKDPMRIIEERLNHAATELKLAIVPEQLNKIRYYVMRESWGMASSRHLSTMAGLRISLWQAWGVPSGSSTGIILTSIG